MNREKLSLSYHIKLSNGEGWIIVDQLAQRTGADLEVTTQQYGEELTFL